MKVILAVEVTETIFKALTELFPETELTTYGNLSIELNTVPTTVEDKYRVAVLELSKLAQTQNPNQ